MAVKASVNTQNQTTVRVGQQNAIRVSSTAAGINAADTATTAVNVVGGRADVTQLAVSGLSTFTGIGSFVSDLYVGGDLYLTDDLVLDNISGSSLDISGISSLGITSATDLEAQQLSISGISTFNEDVKFTGNDTNMRWNHDTSDLTLYDSTRLEFGSNKDFEIWHGGSHTFMKNSGGDLRIRGDKILLKRADDTERYLEANVNNEVKLFFNGNEKFTTTLQGVEIGTVAISTVGFVTATDVWVSGAVTASNINISGISTFAGITTVTGHTLFTKQLSVSGLSTYIGVATYKSDVFIDGTLTAGAIDGGTY